MLESICVMTYKPRKGLLMLEKHSECLGRETLRYAECYQLLYQLELHPNILMNGLSSLFP
jgi:hypothetical protein